MLNVVAFACALATASPTPPVQVTTSEPVEPAQPPQEGFNYARAALEMGIAMGLGATWYQTQIEINKVDFDFARTFSDQGRRLFTDDGWRFDDNERYLNVGHAFMGMYYHQFARANRGTMLQAVAFDLLTSSVWELSVEHREVFSLNDTVVTAVGGIPLGESLFQIGDFFGRAEPTWRNRVLMGLFSPARAIGMLDGSGRLPRAAVDTDGLPRHAYHRFDVGAGAAIATGPTSPTTLGEATTGAARLDMELVNLPRFGRTGQDEGRLTGGEAVRLLVDYSGSTKDLSTLDIAARTSLLGHHRQDVRQEDGVRKGTATLLSAASAFELSYDDEGTFTDFLTTVHMLGPSADLSVVRGPVWLRLGTDLFGDFAMVRPFALQSPTSYALAERGKSTVRKSEYYYALGLTAQARLEAMVGRARAGASVEWNGFDSVEGLDRHQDAYTSPVGIHHPAIEDDLPLQDQRLRLRLFADAPVPLTRAKLAVSYDLQQRSGTFGNQTESQQEGRWSILLVHAL